MLKNKKHNIESIDSQNRKFNFRLPSVRHPEMPLGMHPMFYFTLNGMVMPFRTFK